MAVSSSLNLSCSLSASADSCLCATRNSDNRALTEESAAPRAQGCPHSQVSDWLHCGLTW
jgi:hypothetical protein